MKEHAGGLSPDRLYFETPTSTGEVGPQDEVPGPMTRMESAF